MFSGRPSYFLYLTTSRQYGLVRLPEKACHDGMTRLLFLLLSFPALTFAQEKAGNFSPDRCELIPETDQRVSFRIDGKEQVGWHFGTNYPRPFFHPLNGPSGTSLTRMGHPGAANHDHHTSVWFAHHDVEGESYWAYSAKTTIRQKMWLAYENGEEEAIMASTSGWYNEAGTEMLEQQVVAAIRPMENGEYALEIQTTLTPAGKREKTVLNKTNFGIFAVRVSETLSHHFGGGQLRNSEGAVGEPDIFGKQARWMDYTGPVVSGTGNDRTVATEGITYFDHPENPRYPTYWHVRSDGWMGASFCFSEGYEVTPETPLTLRYLLHVHAGEYDAARAEAIAGEFAKRPGFLVRKSERSHRQYEVLRNAE